MYIANQFFAAWVIIAIIWLWITTLIAIFYPLIDGGIQQMVQVYNGLRKSSTYQGEKPAENTGAYSGSGSSIEKCEEQMSWKMQTRMKNNYSLHEWITDGYIRSGVGAI